MHDMMMPHKKYDRILLVSNEPAVKRPKMVNRKIQSAPGTPMPRNSEAPTESEETLPLETPNNSSGFLNINSSKNGNSQSIKALMQLQSVWEIMLKCVIANQLKYLIASLFLETSKNTMKVITNFHELKVHLDLLKSKKIVDQHSQLMHIRAISKSINAAIDLTKYKKEAF